MKYFIFLLVTMPAFGEVLDLTYLAKLRSASDKNAVERIHNQYEELKQDQKICAIQLARHELPSTCYRLSREKAAWALLSEEETEKFTARLDEACESAAKDAVKGSHEVLAVSEKDLSSVCRKHLLAAKEIIQYRRHESWPVEDGPDLE